MNIKKNIFIVIEGMDSTGKTSVSKKLVKKLKFKYYVTFLLKILSNWRFR